MNFAQALEEASRSVQAHRGAFFVGQDQAGELHVYGFNPELIRPEYQVEHNGPVRALACVKEEDLV